MTMNGNWDVGSASAPPAFETDHMASEGSSSSYNPQQQYHQVTPQPSACYSHRNKQVFACLYTKHLTQKRKVWHDGKLIMTKSPSSFHMVLLKTTPSLGKAEAALEKCDLTLQQGQTMISAGTDETLETEKHLIQVQGLWTESKNLSTSTPSNNCGPSSGMKKILTTKFRKPGRYIPPPPQHTVKAKLLGKRSRPPLQPGELQKRHYGVSSPPLPQQQQQQCSAQSSSNWDGRQQDAFKTHPAAPNHRPPGMASRDTAGYPQQLNRHSRGETAFSAPISNAIFPSRNPYANDGAANRTPQNHPPPTCTRSTQQQQPTQSHPPTAATNAPPVAGFFRNSNGNDGNKENNRSHGEHIDFTPLRGAGASFCNNDFDPNSIYGEEEDEENQNDVSNETPWHRNYNAGSTSYNSCNGSTSIPSQDLEGETDSPTSAWATTNRQALPQQDQTSVGEKNPLSTNELLQLFGVGPSDSTSLETTDTANPKLQQEASLDDPVVESANEQQDETPSAVDDEYGFHLPSQSSSDNSSVDDE